MILPTSICETDTEADLLLRTGRGDRASFEELYRRYSGILFSTAFRVLNNARDAEDVLQGVFIQIWEKASVFDVKRGKPLSWAITLTRNKAIDRLRSVQRRHRLQDDLEREASVWETVAEPDSSSDVSARETQKIVRTAVMQLSKEQRLAIEMAFFGGLTQNEIAQKLDQPLGTVKARIRRGMMKLRQLIEPALEN